MMIRMRREMAGSEPQLTPQIDNLLILDRMVDPVTPLLSQLTYEGLIDEIFGIQHSEWAQWVTFITIEWPDYSLKL